MSPLAACYNDTRLQLKRRTGTCYSLKFPSLATFGIILISLLFLLNYFIVVTCTQVNEMQLSLKSIFLLLSVDLLI